MAEFYEFALELTKSSGFVALASFIFGYLTKRSEINLTENHRRQRFIDEERIKTYRKFFEISLRYTAFYAISKGKQDTNQETQKALSNITAEINILIPEMQILAEKDLYNSLTKLSTLINCENLPNPSKDLEEFKNKTEIEKIIIISNVAGEVQTEIRNEILLTKNRSFLTKLDWFCKK